MKDKRSALNPFTHKEHLDLINDDELLKRSYNEYYSLINQSELLDNTSQGQTIINVAIRLISAVERYLESIDRLDYVEDYYDWDVHLIRKDAVNAFCMPGGKIVIFSGILNVAGSEENLAFILAHEMAHALLDHTRTQMSAQNAKNGLATAARIGSIGLSLLGFGEIGSLAYNVTNIADIGSEFLVMKPFGRSHEIEADTLGIKIINWAGYDINHIPEFWQQMSSANSNNFDFFSTHPTDEKRIQAMREVIFEIQNDKKSISQNLNCCDVCGAILEENAKFCSNCGTRIRDKCPNCGCFIEKTDKFCPNCGEKLYH